MDQRQMLSYLEELEGLLSKKEGLLHYISQQKESHPYDHTLQTFFNAEQDFHAENYENALKNYIQVKTIPLFQFFCFRVSAFIAYRRNHHDQALRFARKAIALQPHDSRLQQLLELMEGEHKVSPHYQADNVTSHILQDTSLPMNSPLSNSGVPPSSASLTRRVFGLTTEEFDKTPLQPFTQDTIMSFTDLEAADIHTEHPHSHHAHPSLNSAEQALENRIQAFQKQRAHSLNKYIKRARSRKQPLDNCLFVFNGWTDIPEKTNLSSDQENPALDYFILSNTLRKPSNGIYLKWNGKGVVINPGKNFLNQFHEAGLHVTDIDAVVVTQTDPDTYADVKEIYHLNYQVNKISTELQIIHYYLNHKAFFELTHILKPNFKQERHAIHNLELFVDSPDVEKIDLTPEITLNYFPTSNKDTLSPHHGDKPHAQRANSSPLGIRIDLKSPAGSHEHRRLTKIGYLSGTPWSPLLSHHLGPCDILFAGFGHTQVNDFSKLNYNDNCLGYYGIYSLADEIKPRMLFTCEFDGREGDIRLEVNKKMRQELTHPHTTETSQVILPADNGLYLDLKNMQLRCSVSEEMVDPTLVRVVKSGEAFSKLLYLAPNCFLE